MKKNFKDYGITPNKSTEINLKVSSIPSNLKRHFWRGVVDADGYIEVADNKDNKLILSGRKSVCEQFKRFLLSNGIETSAMATNTLTLGGRLLSSKVCELLYEDSSVYLERKKTKAEQVINDGK